MKSRTSAAFRTQRARLPANVRRQAYADFKEFRDNPFLPSFEFKCVDSQRNVWSVRIGRSYRALCRRNGSELDWYWIGSHADYDQILRSL